jgi:hypothetical protein
MTDLKRAGQSTVEYLVLLSFILTFGSTLYRNMRKSFYNGILTLGGVLEKDLKTGRGNLGLWNN